MSMLRDLLIRIRGDSSQFEQTTGRVSAAISRVGNIAASVGAVAIRGFGVALTATGAALAAAARSAFKYGGDLEDMAYSMGVATQSLAGLQFAAVQAGASTEQLNGALNIMRRNIADAAVNGGPLVDSLNAIGLSVKDLASLSPDQQFERIVEALGELPAGAERTQAAFAIFGRGAGGIIPLINEGADALRAQKERAIELGIALTDIEAARLAEVGDTATETTKAMQGLANAIGLEVAPYVDAAASQMTEWLISARKMVPQLADAFKVGALAIYNAFQKSLTGVAMMINGTVKAAKAALDSLPGVSMNSNTGPLDDFINSQNRKISDTERTINDIATGGSDSIEGGYNSRAAKGAANKARSRAAAAAVDIKKVSDATKELAKSTKDASDNAKILWNDEFDSKWEEMTRKVRELQLDGMEPLTRGIARYSDELKKAQKNGEDWAAVSSKAFKGVEDVIVGFATTGKLQLGDFFRSLQEDIARTIVQRQITGPLSDAISGAAGSVFSTIFSGMFGGARAAGGPVMGGTPYLVGENGPELFVPQSSGTITPNSRMGGDGGTSVVVNQTLQIGLGVQQGVRQELANMMPAIQAQTQQGVLTAIERGGPMARAVGRRG